jgi:peptidoglycan L-alanyl-D-glutamate endopeptidase CwlK
MSQLDKRDTDFSNLHPTYRAKITTVLDRLASEGLPFKLFEGFRSPQRQMYLYAQGRTRPGGKVTNAVAWQSLHQYGVAADLVLHINGSWSWDTKGGKDKWWRRMNDIGREEGLESLSWELPHLQLDGLKLSDLRAGRYPAGGDETWAEKLEEAIVSWAGAQPAPPAPEDAAARPPIEEINAAALGLDAPPPGSAGWHSKFSGVEWRYDARGVYVRGGGAGPQRTSGQPTTCRRIWELYKEPIVGAARRYGVPPEIIMMTIATETAFARQFNFTGPHTFRWEAHVENRDVNPPTLGDYSAGPMQTLGTTARWVIQAQGLPYQPFAVAPVYTTRPAPPTAHPLYDGATNIDIGTAEIKQRWNSTGDDPILVAAAFNAGSIRQLNSNRWHLKSHGDHLDRAAKWYGDACAVLADVRG